MSIKQFCQKILNYILRGLQHRPVTANIVKLSNSELLNGRTALITGGTSGIGYAIADAFLSAGATVIITSRSETRINDTCGKLLASDETRNSRVYGYVMNMSDVSSIQRVFDKIIGSLQNKIDILVNNAGIFGGGGIFDVSEDEFNAVMNTNLTGTVFLSRIVSRYMIDNGIKGNILNIASSSSLRPANSAYALSKWGIRGLTIGLAKMLCSYGITVNGIAPGPTATPMLNVDGNEDIGHNTSPIGRYAMPEEIANMAIILTSALGRTVVGDIVYMTGGAGIITYDDIANGYTI